MTKFTLERQQPWLKESVRSTLAKRHIAAVKAEPYVALHVRRGDKLRWEAKLTETKVGYAIVRRKQYGIEDGGDAGALPFGRFGLNFRRVSS